MSDLTPSQMTVNDSDGQPKQVDGATLVGGLLLIAIGTLFLLDKLDVADFGNLVREYWPMFFVAIGLPKLFRRELMWTGLWFICLGLWMQLSHSGWFGFTWRSSWPLLLIVGGAGMTLRSLFGVPARRQKDVPHGS